MNATDKVRPLLKLFLIGQNSCRFFRDGLSLAQIGWAVGLRPTRFRRLQILPAPDRFNAAVEQPGAPERFATDKSRLRYDLLSCQSLEQANGDADVSCSQPTIQKT